MYIHTYIHVYTLGACEDDADVASVCVCACACMYVCMYVPMCMHVCMRLYVCTCLMRLYVCMCVCVSRAARSLAVLDISVRQVRYFSK